MTTPLVVAELFDGCNLRCIYCWNRTRKASLEAMDLGLVQQIADRYSERTIAWYNWGEPCLHPQFQLIATMLEGTTSFVSTNLSLDLNTADICALGKFHTVIVSLSGLDAKTYSLYHQKGSLPRVLRNLESLSKLPHNRVIIRWLLHEKNYHQTVYCVNLCQSLGFVFERVSLTCCVEDQEEIAEQPLGYSPRPSTSSECKTLQNIVLDVRGNYLLCNHTQNRPLPFSFQENPTEDQLLDCKLEHPFCKLCGREERWRMYF